jgi:UDPglucose 6-dehydrogenase
MDLENAAELRLGVIGLGHVGLPTALGLADLGWTVIGADADENKTKAIASGNPTFFEPGLDEFLQKQLDSGRFRVTGDVPTAVRQSDVLFVCVATPERQDRSPDLSQVESVARTIAANLNGYKLIVEKSTVPVLTANHLKLNINRYTTSKGITNSQDNSEDGFDVGVNPEFLREGTAIHDFLNPDRIVIGADSERGRETLRTIYRPLIERAHMDENQSVLVTDTRTAEIIKHTSNAFLATKVSFINMVSDLCDATGGDIEMVARGVGLDPRIGSHFFNAGIGYGGSCLPKDLSAFDGVLKQHRINSGLLQEVERINHDRVERFLGKVKEAMWVVKSKTLAIWGLSFKPYTDDIRDAPSLKVVERLLEEGAHLRLHDPRAMDTFAKFFPEDLPKLTYVSSPEEAAEGADAVLLVTEWPDYLEINLSEIRKKMLTPAIVDGRNLFDSRSVRNQGFEYFGMGKP